MIVAIVGPTAVGKTAVSLEIARYLQADIVSCDSVQVYRGLDIGSAKIPLDARQGITHHLIDILEPDTPFSVAAFQAQARAIIDASLAAKRSVVLVGGTGYYIKSVLHDFQFSGRRDATFEARYSHLDNEALHAYLRACDPIRAAKMHPNNRTRVLQALYRYQHGVPASDEQKGSQKHYDYHMIGLDMPRTLLYAQIEQRVDEMFASGLLDEVRALYENNIRGQSVEAIGYRELYDYFSGRIALEEARMNIKQNTRRYAKKQLTYFKNQFSAQWFNVNEVSLSSMIGEMTNYLSETDQKNE